MAEIDPIRRAEIGREKRARTRATLINSACILFASQPVESVTVDDVVRQAGVARGTFYSHFVDLPALVAAVELELVDSVDELLQPARLSIEDPWERLAFGCSRYLDKAAADPPWARIVARLGTRVNVGSENSRHPRNRRPPAARDRLERRCPARARPRDRAGADALVRRRLWRGTAYGERPRCGDRGGPSRSRRGIGQDPPRHRAPPGGGGNSPAQEDRRGLMSGAGAAR